MTPTDTASPYDTAPDVEGYTENEETDISLAREQREIRTRASDPEIVSLYEKTKRGRLNLRPSFQRGYVWDHATASRLIESALLFVPLPIIYLAQEKDGKESVIDGQQRLTSFFSFMEGRFPDGDVFRLTGLQVFPELNKKTFGDIPDELKERIRYYQIRTITILDDSDRDLKFEIFKRLNTGAAALKDGVAKLRLSWPLYGTTKRPGPRCNLQEAHQVIRNSHA